MFLRLHGIHRIHADALETTEDAFCDEGKKEDPPLWLSLRNKR